MKAAVVREPGVVRVEDVPEPECGPFDARVRILACATCSSTDLKLVDHAPSLSGEYPGILGHESVGEVVAVGAEVRYLHVGDRVLRPTAVFPGESLGEFRSLWGGFAEYGKVTDARALAESRGVTIDQVEFLPRCQQPAPGDIGPAEATMLVTLKETLGWLQELGVERGKSVLVVGDGAVGLTMARWAKVMGAGPVAVCGHHADRLERATQLGADAVILSNEQDVGDVLKRLTGGGVDYVADAVGLDAGLREAIGWLRRGGRIGLYGISPSRDVRFKWADGPGCFQVHFSYGGEPRVHDQVVDAVRLGLVDPRAFYTHRLALVEIGEAIELLRRREALKVVVDIGTVS